MKGCDPESAIQLLRREFDAASFSAIATASTAVSARSRPSISSHESSATIGLPNFFAKPISARRATLAGQRDYRVGTGDNHGVARLADAGGNRELDMAVRRVPIDSGQDSDCMPTLLARARRCGFHHARAPAVEQHGAAARDLTADCERQLAYGGGASPAPMTATTGRRFIV